MARSNAGVPGRPSVWTREGRSAYGDRPVGKRTTTLSTGICVALAAKSRHRATTRNQQEAGWEKSTAAVVLRRRLQASPKTAQDSPNGREYLPRRCPCGPTVVGIVLKLASRDVRPARGPRMRRGRRRLCGALRATIAAAASESPAQGRQFYADETLMPSDRRRSGEWPPVRSRSPLPAIHLPRLPRELAGLGAGRYAARASAGPIRNSILSKHLRQLGGVRRDAAGLVPPRPACA